MTIRLRAAAHARVIVVAAAATFAAAALVFACGSEDGGGAAECERAGCADGSANDVPSPPDAGVDAGDGAASTDGGGGDASDASDADADGSATCSGEAGTLDETFGEGGVLWLKYPGAQGEAVAVQADGRILIGGGFGSAAAAILRTDSKGTLDPTFGASGIVQLTPGTDSNVVFALALQPDGKVIAAGSAGFSNRDPDFFVARMHPDGTLDATFGAGGVILTDFGGRGDYAHSVAVLPDGRILASGLSELNAVASTSDFVVARYKTDGSLDETFGIAGRVQVDVRGTADSPGVMALAAGGKIAIAGGSGQTTSASTKSDLAVVRLDADGSLDPTFAAAGKLVTSLSLPGSHHAYSLVVDAAGRLVLAGGTGADFITARVTTAGALDTTFDTDGVVLADFAGRGDDALGVVAQSDGRVLVAGQSSDGSRTGLALARYGPTGAFDSNFGSAGQTLLVPLSADTSYGVSGAAATTCGVLVVGTWFYDLGAITRNAIGVARFRR